MFRAIILGGTLALGAAGSALAHGDGAPAPIATDGLPSLGEDFKTQNPYRGNDLAVRIGEGGYNQNCARCHGLDVKSGGMAPDLRELTSDETGDSWFAARVTGGATKDGRVRMPPFGEILSQEAIWAIRTYVESRPKD
ncbi:cytochrome c-550 PedF [Methylopila sp. M107]|uniref:cytochrome c-550 PedF n=1 Tax=Methylopila sp. M107 TaxID=1101190 RepID=UPI00037C04BA|nr:cytochrome c-550 PedF [Methylopila sp. M107]